eukprot:7161280-Lingulodinium_polyedra.AAC.1
MGAAATRGPCRFGASCWRPWCSFQHGRTAARAARLRGLADWWARARDALTCGLGGRSPSLEQIGEALDDVMAAADSGPDLDSSGDERPRFSRGGGQRRRKGACRR